MLGYFTSVQEKGEGKERKEKERKEELKKRREGEIVLKGKGAKMHQVRSWGTRNGKGWGG